MVSSAVFGAAAGTGLALVVAMTIVVYRYYAVKRKGKYWSNLDRWPDPPSTSRNKQESQEKEGRHHCHSTPSSHVLDCWRKPQTTYYAVHSADFNIAKQQHAVQPSSTQSGGLPHQGRSYPGTSGSGSRQYGRNSSVSSQSSLESSSGTQSHRGSPQIRAFGPDGRFHRHRDPLHTASSYPPSRSSRSPSPGRAASLDARCGSPASCSASFPNSNPSQSSLSSLAVGASSSCCTSTTGAQGSSKVSGRCLSPLLIPPCRTSASSDGGPVPPASPLGSLQPDLYQRTDGPVYISARRNGKSLGRLHLQLKYDFDQSDLHVHLIEAQELAGSNQGGFNEPYVQLSLSPEVDSRKRQTQIYRNELNPFFDQKFKFPVSYDELQDKTLVLQVLDDDRFSRNDVVGSVKIAFDSFELASITPSLEVWVEIEREKKPPDQIQEVFLSLSYLPSAQRLTVQILKARNLFLPEQNSDAFVKVNLLRGEKRVKKKKTTVTRASTSPVWNEEMSFNISSEELPSSAIEVCVMRPSNELIGGKSIVGSCIIGPATGVAPKIEGTGNQGREHWLHMTQSPREAISMWHTLH